MAWWYCITVQAHLVFLYGVRCLTPLHLHPDVHVCTPSNFLYSYHIIISTAAWINKYQGGVGLVNWSSNNNAVAIFLISTYHDNNNNIMMMFYLSTQSSAGVGWATTTPTLDVLAGCSYHLSLIHSCRPGTPLEGVYPCTQSTNARICMGWMHTEIHPQH